MASSHGEEKAPIIFDRNNESDLLMLRQLKELSIENEHIKALIAQLEDSNREKNEIPFDLYFMLLDKLWSHPVISKDAHVITMDKRMEDAAPYNVFFNCLKHAPETEKELCSIKFTDLLCPSLGKLKCSFHITHVVKISWMLAKFAARKLHKLPMTIIHSHKESVWPDNSTMKALYPDIDSHYIETKQRDPLGCHHTKLGIFMYDDDSLRLVISTANLYADDWDIYNQQIWISPKCPRLPDGSSIMSGESPTGFKAALLDYLHCYKVKDIPSLRTWINRVKSTDFQEIKVALLFTAPGIHYPRKNGSLVHYMGHLLSRDCIIPAPKKEHDFWPVVAQTGTLGLMGQTSEEWLTTNLLKALGSHQDSPYLPTVRMVAKVKFNLVYPTMENCRRSYLGYAGGGCCHNDPKVKALQPWLKQYECQWKADQTKRTRALSHSKCYFRLSPCSSKMSYYFLTSANLTRSAWGCKPNADSSIYVRSYETGILFLPKYFGEEYFEVKETANMKNKRLFPVMLDLPLTPYGPLDDSFCPEEFEELSSSQEYSALNEGLQNLNISSSPVKSLSNKDAQHHEGSTLTDDRNIKYGGKPTKDLFFPSFKKE